MAKILIQNSTVHKLDNVLIEDESNRGYLGLSGIGHECMTYIWLNWRKASKKIIPRRTKRIFERGDIEEPRIIRDLKEINIQCFRRDEDGNDIEIFGHKDEEQEVIKGFAGHAKGHTDGRVLGLVEAPKTEHLAEFKTMKETYYNKFKSKGLFISHPVYYSQVQRYMHGMKDGDGQKIKRAAVFARNKNTEETHLERIKYDKEHAEMLSRKEQHIVLSELPPAVKFKSSSFTCKFCNHKEICHNGKRPEKNCRTCDYCDVYDNGIWKCRFNGDKELSFIEQKLGCGNHKRLF